MSSPMKGLLKGLRYITRIFENEKEPEIEIGKPTDVKHVAHIGWEGPSTTTPSWMHDYKSSMAESKEESNKNPTSSAEKVRNKGRRKTSTDTNNLPIESPTRVGESTKPSKRSKGKQREQSTYSESDSSTKLDLLQHNEQSVRGKQTKQKKSKGSTRGKVSEPLANLGSSTGR